MRGLLHTCAAAFLVGLAAGCGGTSAGERPLEPVELTLQRSDLPPVYRRGDDSGCGPMGTEGAPPPLARLVVAENPNGCVLQLERAYGDEPPLVESAALTFPNADGARDGLAAAEQLVPFLMGEFPQTSRRADAPARIGDETVMLEPAGVTVQGISGRPGRALVWRSGSVVAAVLVAGVPTDEALARAVVLARLQQQHIEQPAPVTTTGDAEVALDDPAIEVPVYWLGSTFAPDGFPAVQLQDASRLTPGSGPGDQLKLDYYDERVRHGVHLDTWTPAAWTSFRRTPLGRGIWSSPCATIRLPDGTATLYGNCTTGPVAAAVRFGGVIVTVNMPYCLSCSAPSGYETRAGTEAVIRGLKLRP